MTVLDMNKVLAKQANDVELLGREIPGRVQYFINNAKKYGSSCFDPIAIRIACRLEVMRNIYAFILGYISEDELYNSLDWFECFDYKFWEHGEYAHLYKNAIGIDRKYRHISLRPARLLPQH